MKPQDIVCIKGTCKDLTDITCDEAFDTMSEIIECELIKRMND